jgi:isoquinoline 1-oxidoreductase subunit beta
LPAYAGSTAGFAIGGKSYWHAKRAADAVQVQWQQRPAGALDSKHIASELEAAVRHRDGHVFHSMGDVDDAELRAARRIEAWYSAPYLAHATLEPMNCTARVSGGKVEVWAPTQVPEMCRSVAAGVAGVRTEDVDLHVTLIGGGFGRRLEVDYAAFAVRVAMDCPGSAVQLIWPREEDMTHDFYRPMQAAMLRASIDSQGKITSLRIKSAGDAISPRWLERGIPTLASPIDTPDKTTAEGLFDQPYGFEHQHMEHVATRMGVPVGFWRSVGHSHNAFISESFVDELAFETKRDPLMLRRELLNHAPRHLAVLDLAAEKAAWGGALPSGWARGLAMHESFGTIVAQIAEASLEEGVPRVHRVVCALDCGVAVNPAIVAQQMEGGVIFALSSALHGAIDIVDGVVQQRNFPSYPLMKMSRAPKVETFTVQSSRAPAGIGEPGVPPLAAAVANALFALTGKRRRSVPLMT